MRIDFNNEGAPLLPARAVEIIDAMLATPAGSEAARGDDDQRRNLTKAIVEQLEFEDPSAGFVTKSASSTRPQSKDAIGIVVGGKLYCWDWQNGDTRARSVQAGQPAMPIFDQNPIEVSGVNHLRVSTPAPTPTPDPTPTPTPQVPSALSEKLDRAIDLLGAIVTLLSTQGQQLDAIERTQQAEAVVIGNTAANVSEALNIARTIHETTTHQAGEAERVSTNVHEAAVRVGEIANGIAPLINLLAALRK